MLCRFGWTSVTSNVSRFITLVYHFNGLSCTISSFLFTNQLMGCWVVYHYFIWMRFALRKKSLSAYTVRIYCFNLITLHIDVFIYFTLYLCVLSLVDYLECKQEIKHDIWANTFPSLQLQKHGSAVCRHFWIWSSSW